MKLKDRVKEARRQIRSAVSAKHFDAIEKVCRKEERLHRKAFTPEGATYAMTANEAGTWMACSYIVEGALNVEDWVKIDAEMLFSSIRPEYIQGHALGAVRFAEVTSNASREVLALCSMDYHDIVKVRDV